MQRSVIASWLLTAALVLIFGFFGVDKFIHPFIWIGWIPSWMDGLLGLSANVWLGIIGGVEIATALLLLLPRTRRFGCLLAILQLLGILTQVGWNDVGARDLAILLSAAALWVLSRP